MTEHGFYHPDFGYWQTTTYPSDNFIVDHPVGTVEVPLRPSPDYIWKNGEWNFVAPVPPTIEELRENMLPLTARQFRLGLLQSGRSLSQVETAIAAIANPVEQETAQVEWEYAAEFKRTHPLVVSLSVTLGFAPEEVDTLWQSSLQL